DSKIKMIIYVCFMLLCFIVVSYFMLKRCNFLGVCSFAKVWIFMIDRKIVWGLMGILHVTFV
ncbi:MAG: hypothetical protein SOY65_02760, partial [Marinifilaceae bacterium]|nr:hypothetical protein [Marinifilaceae bacterium]